MPAPVPKRPKKLPTKKELIRKLKTDPRTEPELVDDGVKIVVSHIREEIMKYYKGDCVGSVIPSRIVRVYEDDQSGRLYYQRREREIQRPSTMYLRNLDNAVLAKLGLQPDKITFAMTPFNRSPEFRSVFEGVRSFMRTYLQGVELNEDMELGNESNDGSGDRQYMISLARYGMPDETAEEQEEEVYNEVHRMGGTYFIIDEDGSLAPVNEDYARRSRDYFERRREARRSARPAVVEIPFMRGYDAALSSFYGTEASAVLEPPRPRPSLRWQDLEF